MELLPYFLPVRRRRLITALPLIFVLKILHSNEELSYGKIPENADSQNRGRLDASCGFTSDGTELLIKLRQVWREKRLGTKPVVNLRQTGYHQARASDASAS